MKQLDEVQKRRKAVDNALGILLTDGKIPNENYLKALGDFVAGEVSFEELDQRVHELRYIQAELKKTQKKVG